MHDQGVPFYPGRGLSPVQEDRDPAAEKACAGLMPRMPIALDRDRNPRFAQDLASEIACVNAHGDPVVGDPAGGFWTYREPRTVRERRMSTLAGRRPLGGGVRFASVSIPQLALGHARSLGSA